MNKSEQRARARKVLSLLDESYFSFANDEITKRVLDSEWFKNSKNIFVYVSIENEPDTKKIINTALKNGKNVFVPKCVSKSEMLAVKINSLDELSVGMFKIPEPQKIEVVAEPSQIDTAVVPCVSASPDGKRLGHGAGFYDRFLQRTQATKVCLCYSELIFKDIETSQFDVPMDYIITEKNDGDT